MSTIASPAPSTLAEKIEAALADHIAGLIRGDELEASEVEHWVVLLTMADESPAPVKRAQFFGFTFITRKSHIREAIAYLISR